MYKRHATINFISDAVSTLPLVDLEIFFIYWHEDNSVADKISTHYCPFTASFKTKFMTLVFTAEYHHCSNVLYMSAVLQQCTTVTSCSRSADTVLPSSLSPFSAVTFSNLLGEMVKPLSSTSKILFLGGICAYEILNVNDQNIWLLKLH